MYKFAGVGRPTLAPYVILGGATQRTWCAFAQSKGANGIINPEQTSMIDARR